MVRRPNDPGTSTAAIRRKRTLAVEIHRRQTGRSRNLRLISTSVLFFDHTGRQSGWTWPCKRSAEQAPRVGSKTVENQEPFERGRPQAFGVRAREAASGGPSPPDA